MFDKLGEVEKKYEALCHQLQNPDVVSDQNKFRQLMKEQAELERVVKIYRHYKQLTQTIADNKLGLQVAGWEEASGLIGQFIVVLRVVLYIAIFIIFLVALVIINNSMVMATLERVTEIGTMRAIGAQQLGADGT